MELLLSGARHANAEQRDVSASTGGYISVTPVPNGRLNALFDDIGCYEQHKQTQTTLAFFLRNNSDSTVNNVVLQQIHQTKFGQNVAQAEFSWAAVEPADNVLIERIGNLFEMPYNAEFFQPNCRREDAIVKVLTPGVAGDVLSVLGVTFTLEGNEIIDVVSAMVDAFENHPDFNVEFKSDNEVYFQRKALVSTGDSISILTPGTATSQPVNLSGFLDEGVLLIEQMKPGETIGLWCTRKVKSSKEKGCFDIEKKFDEEFGTEFHENTMDEHGDTEECLEVIFSFI
jgi:hypothetical protein